MHIAFLTTEYPHPQTGGSGGIGTSIKNLANSFVKNGHEVTVFACFMNEDMKFSDNGIRVVAIKKKAYPILSYLFYQRYVSKIISKYDFDIIEVPDFGGLTAFMSFKAPCLMKFHGSDTYFCRLEHRKQNQTIRLLEKIAARKANAYIGVSKFALAFSFQILPIRKSAPHCHIYNGIDTGVFNKVEDSATSEHYQTILYYGTLIRKKGVLELPHIFNIVHQKMPNVRLILAGNDAHDYKENCSTWELMKERFNRDSLSHVYYLGKLPYEDMTNLIREANVCVFPSYAEAFPVSWLEAMSMGKAIVGSNKEWAHEAIEDSVCGFLAAPSDHASYAKRIIELLQNNNENKEFGINARKRVLNLFSNEVIARNHIEFYKRVIDA